MKKLFLIPLFLLIDNSVFAQTGNIGFGTINPDPSAKLHIASTTAGFLPPSMTTAQRDLIVSPATGLTIYNTDAKCLEFYNGTTWFTLCGSVNGGTAILTAGSLDCTGSLAGTYTATTPMTASNTKTIGVNVATTGTYSVTTGAVNGVTFSGSGTFTGTGAQNVVLTATGIPFSSGTSTYLVTNLGQTCTFNVAYGTAPLGAATGTINCLSGTQANGSYKIGNIMTNTNTKNISVNATIAGSYNITTNAVNGISFSSSGSFATTGTQTVTLIASGTPTTVGSSTFTVSGVNSATCTFNVPVVGLADFIFAIPATTSITGISDIPFTSSSNRNANVSGSNITLKAGKRYLLNANISAYVASGATNSEFMSYSFVDASNVALPASTLGQVVPSNGTRDANGSQTASAEYTVGGSDVVVKVRAILMLGAPFTLQPGYSSLSVVEIPASSDYVYANPSTSSVASVSDFSFTSLANLNASVSGSSITLKAGKRYLLNANIALSNGGAANYLNYAFVDAANVQLTGSATGQAIPADGTLGQNGSAIASAVYLVGGSDIVVKLRATTVSGGTFIVQTAYSSLSIVEIPSTSDFLFAQPSTTSVSGATDCAFTSIANQGASVSGSSITLKAGKRYLLNGDLSAFGTSGTPTVDYFGYALVDVANNSLTGAAAGLMMPQNANYGSNGSSVTTATYLVGASDVVIKLRSVNVNGGPFTIQTGFSSLSAVEIP